MRPGGPGTQGVAAGSPVPGTAVPPVAADGPTEPFPEPCGSRVPPGEPCEPAAGGDAAVPAKPGEAPGLPDGSRPATTTATSPTTAVAPIAAARHRPRVGTRVGGTS